MGKEQISSDYLKNTKAQYLRNPKPPKDRRAIVMGWDSDNIGYAISHQLVAAGFYVDCYKKSELQAEDVGAAEDFNTYDTIVFNNGTTHLDWIENHAYDEIARVIDDCLVQTIHGVSAFVRHTLDAPWRKNIVMIGSMAYNHVLNGSAPYCAAKAGLAHFTRCIAYELAPKNYSVFCVHPSNVDDAPMSQQTIQELMRYRGLTIEEAQEYWAAGNPNAEFLERLQVGKLVRNLVTSDLYLSGSNIEMAGGQR